jgi:hypothetical protein
MAWIKLRNGGRGGLALKALRGDPTCGSADLRQECDAVEGSGNAHTFAIRFFHPHDRSLAERPSSGPQTKARRQHDDQFQLRARFHARLGIDKNSRGTEITSQALVLAAAVTHLDRDTNWHPLARTPVRDSGFLSHMLRKFTPVCRNRGVFTKKSSSRRFTGGEGRNSPG